MGTQRVRIFGGKLGIRHNGMHLVRGEHLCHASFPKLIRGRQNNHFISLLCQRPNRAAARVIDIGKSVLLRIPVNSHKDLIQYSCAQSSVTGPVVTSATVS